MRVVSTLLRCLFVILNSIELSSQSGGSPDGGHFPGSHCRGPSLPPPGGHTPDTTLTLANPHYSASSPPPVEPPLRDRSRSPTLSETFRSVLGFRFEELALIRLSPYVNPNRIYRLRRYVIPPHKPIRVRTKNYVLNPMPNGEQIVLSTSDGDVYALLEKKADKHTILRAIYSPENAKRVKINMNSGAVEELTADEIAECPVHSHKQIARSYAISLLGSQSKGLNSSDPNPNFHRCGPSSFPGIHCSDATLTLDRFVTPSGSAPPVESPVRERSRSPTLRNTFPIVLGFKFEYLESIRLIPHNYPDHQFELRRYVFPPDKPLGLKTKNHYLNPMPKGEQIVLSTSDSDVCAILGKTPRRTTILRPLYTTIPGTMERVKINIDSGTVEKLSTEEVEKCPVTAQGPISKFYRISRA